MSLGEPMVSAQLVSQQMLDKARQGRVGVLTAYMAQMLSQYESAGGDLLNVQITVGEDMVPKGYGGARIMLHGYPARTTAPALTNTLPPRVDPVYSCFKCRRFTTPATGPGAQEMRQHYLDVHGIPTEE